MKVKVERLEGLPDMIREGVKEVTLEFVRIPPGGPVVDVGIDFGDEAPNTSRLTHFRVHRVTLSLEEAEG